MQRLPESHPAQVPAPARASEPAYLELARRDELRRRAAEAVATLGHCRLCPRACGVNRLRDQTGVCRIGRYARVASAFPHLGEEDCLRGWRGSGTIFFSGCNLRCVFCQNHDISHAPAGKPVTAEHLAAVMLELQAAGCHNLNWVTPSHVVPQLLEALPLAAAAGLHLPIVYNSSGYDAVDTLRWLEGVVDIYLPDFKFWDPAVARRLAHAPDYPEVARAAIREMHRQVGDLVCDASGLARRGLLVRHLVLPAGLAGTRLVAEWLAREISPHTRVNVMAQYHPDGRVLMAPRQFPELTRPLDPDEYRQARVDAQAAGLTRLEAERG